MVHKLDRIKNLKKINDDSNNGGNLYTDYQLLYKLFDDNPCFLDEKERNVHYLYKKRLFHPYVLDILYHGFGKKKRFLGYVQEFIPNAKTFRDGISDQEISYEEKEKIIGDVFDKLRILHAEDKYLGDVHLENFIYNEDGGYIIDLDEIRFQGVDDFNFEDCYLIKPDHNSPAIRIADRYTDNVKTMIASLSFLYGFDLEAIVKNGTLVDVKQYLECMIEDKEFQGKVFQILDCRDEVTYFDEILGNTVSKKERSEKR